MCTSYKSLGQPGFYSLTWTHKMRFLGSGVSSNQKKKKFLSFVFGYLNFYFVFFFYYFYNKLNSLCKLKWFSCHTSSEGITKTSINIIYRKMERKKCPVTPINTTWFLSRRTSNLSSNYWDNLNYTFKYFLYQLNDKEFLFLNWSIPLNIINNIIDYMCVSHTCL